MKRLSAIKFNLQHPKIVNQKENKRRWLKIRSDVVNKTLLRAVKRFYYTKFKILEKSMVKRRFKNAKTTDILDALVKFWQQQFQNLKFKINYELFAEFMMLFLGIKSNSTYKFDPSIFKKAKQALECMN